MRITQLEPANVGQQGDRLYRTEQPCRALAACGGEMSVVSGSWLSPTARAAALHAEVLVLCKVAEPDLLPLLSKRGERGLRTVYEINDDFTDVQPWNPTAGFFSQPENRSLVTQLARKSDAIQFSSRGLQEKFRRLHTRSVLLPNQLARIPERSPRCETRHTVTVGWGGSYGHREDLAACMPSLRAVMAARPELRLAIMGDRRLAKLFTWVPRGRFTFTRAGSLELYQRFLQTLDVGIAPLLPTPFNRGRSDIKLLEYAAHGVVPVCANEVPYEQSVRTWDNGVLFDDADELERALLRIINDGDLRRTMAERAYATVAEGRLQHQHAAAQLAFYADLSPRPDARAADAFSTIFQTLTADSKQPRYRTCPVTRAEQHLYNGLISQADRKRARSDLAKAAKLDPDNYVIHMHLARMEGGATADRRFARCMAQAPESCASPYLRGLAALAASDFDSAEAHLSAALSTAPDYAPALAKRAALRERRGSRQAAISDYAASLQACPDYGIAALGLANLQMRSGALDEAAIVLQTHRDACAGDHRYWVLLGQIALVQHDASAALSALTEAEKRCPDRDALAPLLAKARALAGTSQQPA